MSNHIRPNKVISVECRREENGIVQFSYVTVPFVIMNMSGSTGSIENYIAYSSLSLKKISKGSRRSDGILFSSLLSNCVFIHISSNIRAAMYVCTQLVLYQPPILPPFLLHKLRHLQWLRRICGAVSR